MPRPIDTSRLLANRGERGGIVININLPNRSKRARGARQNKIRATTEKKRDQVKRWKLTASSEAAGGWEGGGGAK